MYEKYKTLYSHKRMKKGREYLGRLTKRRRKDER